MFKWLTNSIDNTRIAIAYPRYERQCRRIWEEDAESKYSTAELESEIKSRMRKSTAHATRTYEKPIRELEKRQKSVQGVVADAGEKLAILQRNYKAELDSAYETLNETRKKLDKCKKKLSIAYDDLEAAKSKLNAWFKKSKKGGFSGNEGEELPEHSIFGQNLGDRDRYKRERDNAAREIGRYKSEQSKIGRRIGDLKAEIIKIKQDRQQMFDLKKAGFDKVEAENAVSNGKTELRSISKEIVGIHKLRDDYINQAKVSLGVYDLEKQIARLRRGKQRYIKSFDSDKAVSERKITHRVEWMAARGKHD